MASGKPVTMRDSITIALPAKKIFDYVSRPDLWHEWHPASTSAELPRIPLQTGDAFREIITVSYPLVKVRRHTAYRVTISKPETLWEVQGESSLFDLTIHYEFIRATGGTIFQRDLTYSVKGPLAWFEPVVVRPKISRQSKLALKNLKLKLESKSA